MTPPLSGLTVVVTRPEGQAGPMLRLLREAGATPLAFPTIEIERIVLDEASRKRCAPDAHDWVIYTSANAVEHAMAQLPRPMHARVAAVGRATARLLQEHGIEVDAVPPKVSDSEGLLGTTGLADVAGRRILILKGVGGRDVLRESLTRRGAAVTLGEVYRRRVASPDPGALAELERACVAGPPVITVTSVEVLDALLQLAPESRLPRLRDAPLLLPGARVAEAARARGWRGPVVVATSAEDATMLDALVRAHRAGSFGGPA